MKKIPLLLTASLLAVPSFATAQSPDTRANAKAAAPASGKMEEVLVQARKRAENVQDVPLAISAFSGDTLEQRGASSIVDVSRQTPGVFFAQGPGGATTAFLSIRGQTQPDTVLTADSSVGVYFDGVYIPRQFGLMLSMFDVDRVEVLKGPQGTLYGKNTTGGAVNVFTTQPGDIFEGYFKLTGGSRSLVRGEAGVTVPFSDKASARIAGFVNKQDAIQENTTGHDLGSDDSSGARINLKLEPTETIHITMGADMLHANSGGARTVITDATDIGDPHNSPLTAPLSLVQVETMLEAGLVNPFQAQSILKDLVASKRDNSAGPVQSSYDTTGGSFGITFDLPDWHSEIKSLTAYRTMDRLDVLDLDGTPYTFFAGRLPTDSDFLSEELQLADDGSKQDLHWIVGAYYNRETGHDGSTSVFLPELIPYVSVTDGEVENTSYSYFGQTTVGVTDRINVTAGLRYTSETKKLTSRNHDEIGGAPIDCNVPGGTIGNCEANFSDTFDDVSYLFSVDYKLNEDALIYAKTSHSFRGGGQNLRGAYDNTLGRGTFAPFDPETATDYEIGLKSQLFDRRLIFNLAAYYTKYDNVQRNVFVQLSPTSPLLSQIVNAASAHISGGELEITYRPTERFTLGAGVGLVDAQYDKFDDATVAGGSRKNEPFPVPEWTYNLLAAYTQPTSFGDIAFQANYSWQSEVNYFGYAFDDFAVTQGSYGLLNANITAHLAEFNADIALYGTNLLDEEYLSTAVSVDNPGASLGYSYGMLGQPREVGLRLTKRFGK